MSDFIPNIKQLTGQEESHLSDFDGSIYLHKEIVSDWLALSVAAAYAGFELAIASGFRSFERQLVIWNEKASGKRTLLDADERVISAEQRAEMDDKQLLFSMLRWSAIPGFSRHHWGTDIDVYDKNCVQPNDSFELLAGDCIEDGKFAALHEWLDGQIANDSAKGFFRPYCGENKILNEPWHLSHWLVSSRFEAQLSPQFLLEFCKKNTQIALSATIVDNFDTVYEQCIRIAN